MRNATATTSLARALFAAGYLAFAQAAAGDAQSLLSASLSMGREVGDSWSESYALHGLGHAALLRGAYAEARTLYQQRLAIATQQRDEYAMGQALNSLGEVARCLNEPAVARDFYEQSLEIRRRLGDTRGVAMGLANLGQVLVADGSVARARAVLTESMALTDQLGHEYGQAVCLTALAGVSVAERRFVVAARLLGAAAGALDNVGNILEPPDLAAYEQTLAQVCAALGPRFEVEFSHGRQMHLRDAIALATQSGEPDAPAPPPRASEVVSALSPRELEVVVLIARGQTSEDIARALVISRRTADTHAEHIRDKLGLRSRAEIAAWAIRHGLA